MLNFKKLIYIVFFNVFVIQCLLPMEWDSNLKRKRETEDQVLDIAIDGQRENKRARIAVEDDSTELDDMQKNDELEDKNLTDGYLYLPEELKRHVLIKIIVGSPSFKRALQVLESIKKIDDQYLIYAGNSNELLKFLIYKWGFYKVLASKLPNFFDIKFVFKQELESRLINFILSQEQEIVLSFAEVKTVYTKLILFGLKNNFDRNLISKLIEHFGSKISNQTFNDCENRHLTTMKQLANNILLYNWNVHYFNYEDINGRDKHAEDLLSLAVKANCHEIIIELLNQGTSYIWGRDENEYPWGLVFIFDYATSKNCLLPSELELEGFTTFKLLLDICPVRSDHDNVRCAIEWNDLALSFNSKQMKQIIDLMKSHDTNFFTRDIELMFCLSFFSVKEHTVNGCLEMVDSISESGDTIRLLRNPFRLFPSALDACYKLGLDFRNYSGKNLITLAIRNRVPTEELKKLLASEIDINMYDNKGRTVLHYYYLKKDLIYDQESLKLLLENPRLNVNARDKNGDTALILAIKKLNQFIFPEDRHGHNLEFIKLLLKYNSNINLSNNEFKTPLILALEENNIDIVRFLLSMDLEKKLDLNCKDHMGRTALMYATEQKNIEIVKLLLERGASILQCDNGNNTALMIALKVGSLEIAELLVSKDISANYLNITSTNNESALSLAISQGYLELVNVLLAHGVDYESRKTGYLNHSKIRTRMQPLTLAALYGNKEMVKLLLDKGANINAEDSEKNTPLIYACWLQKKEIAQILLENGAEVDEKVLRLVKKMNNTDLIALLSKYQDK